MLIRYRMHRWNKPVDFLEEKTDVLEKNQNFWKKKSKKSQPKKKGKNSRLSGNGAAGGQMITSCTAIQKGKKFKIELVTTTTMRKKS